MLKFTSPTNEPIFVKPSAVIAIETGNQIEKDVGQIAYLLLTSGETIVVSASVTEAHAAIELALSGATKSRAVLVEGRRAAACVKCRISSVAAKA